MQFSWLTAVFALSLVQVEAQKNFHLSTGKLAWSAAENYCTQRKGHLASVHNAFQNNAFMVTAQASCQSFFIGGTCGSVTNCTWTDSSKFDYNSFMAGQNSGFTSVQVKTGRWQLVDGRTADCFICAQDAPMTDCNDWRKAGFTEDGFYTATINGNQETLFCDMTTQGGGWTLIQKRVDGTEFFWNRTWATYKAGFGKAQTNFWAGNELIHQLTTKDNKSTTTLRIDMWDDGTPFSGQANTYWWNDYDNFQLSSEADLYRLQLSLNWQNIQGNASTAWYDITYSSGAPFSTVDKINDPQQDCVTKYQMGGWWLYNCAFATLNGAYIPKDWSTGYGLFWIVDGGDTVIHPRKTTMMIRPASKLP